MRNARLLILACSQTKLAAAKRPIVPSPLELYDGPAYRTLRSYRPTAPSGLLILSAEYGLLRRACSIKPYDRRLDRDRAAELVAPAELERAARLSRYEAACAATTWREAFFVGGRLYREVIQTYAAEGFFGDVVTYARGPIGEQLSQLKAFLERCRADERRAA